MAALAVVLWYAWAAFGLPLFVGVLAYFAGRTDGRMAGEARQ
jgi:biotin transporter BioY